MRGECGVLRSRREENENMTRVRVRMRVRRIRISPTTTPYVANGILPTVLVGRPR